MLVSKYNLLKPRAAPWNRKAQEQSRKCCRCPEAPQVGSQSVRVSALLFTRQRGGAGGASPTTPGGRVRAAPPRPAKCRVIRPVSAPARGMGGRHSGGWGEGRRVLVTRQHPAIRSAAPREDPLGPRRGRGARGLSPLRRGRASAAAGTVGAEGRGRRGRARSGRPGGSAPGFRSSRGPSPPRRSSAGHVRGRRTQQSR